MSPNRYVVNTIIGLAIAAYGQGMLKKIHDKYHNRDEGDWFAYSRKCLAATIEQTDEVGRDFLLVGNAFTWKSILMYWLVSINVTSVSKERTCIVFPNWRRGWTD